MTIWVQGTTRKKAVVLKSKSSSTDFLVAVLLKLNISSTAFRTPFIALMRNLKRRLGENKLFRL